MRFSLSAKIFPWNAESPWTRQAYLFAVVCALGAALYFVLAPFLAYSLTSGLAQLFFYLVFGLVVLVLFASAKLVGPTLLAAGSMSGVALYFAWSASTSNCIDDPSLASDLGLPTCNGLFALAVTAGVLAALAAGASAFLFRKARLDKAQKLFAAAGVLVITILVTASAIAISTPPVPVDGYTSVVPLPFPIPKGTIFLINSIGQPGAQANVRVQAKGFEPIAIFGAWNSTETICLYMSTVAFNLGGPPQGTAYGTCGTNVTFHYPLQSATWVVQFYVPLERRFASNVTVRIVKTVCVVY